MSRYAIMSTVKTGATGEEYVRAGTVSLKGSRSIAYDRHGMRLGDFDSYDEARDFVIQHHAAEMEAPCVS